MSDKKFTTHGDEPVEARIVAWVLGEASAFEAEELQRLCDEQAELAVFKRRMEAVHRLAGEAHEHSGDARWKLPIKKRTVLEELIGEREDAVEELARDQRIGRSGRQALLAIAACVVLTLVVVGLMSPVYLIGIMDHSESSNHGRTLESPNALLEQNQTTKKDGKMKSSAPSASAPKVIEATGVSPLSIAVPEVEVNEPSESFGLDGDFGNGWASGNGRESEKKKMAENTPKTGDLPVIGSLFSDAPAGAIDVNARENSAPGQSLSAKLGPRTRAGGGAGGGAGEWDDEEMHERARTDILSDAGDAGHSQNLGAWDSQRSVDPAITEQLQEQPAPSGAGGRKEKRLTKRGSADPTSELEVQKPYYDDWVTDNNQKAKLADQSLEDHQGANEISDRDSVQTESFSLLTGVEEGGLKQDLSMLFESFDDSEVSLHTDEELEPIQPDAVATFNGVTDLEKRNKSRVNVSPAPGSIQFDYANKGLDVEGNPEQSNDSVRQRESNDDAVKSLDLAFKESELLNQVDANWMLSIPAEERLDQLSPLAKREIIRRQNDVVEADDLLMKGHNKLEEGDHLAAIENYRSALQMVPDAPLFEDLRELYREHLTHAQELLERERSGRKRPIVTEEETRAADEPYSTFSLNISDASFRIAQAALARGEMPDPLGIKVEQFYNAVDYSDPAPAAGQPVACKIEQAAHPIIPGRNLVRVAIKTASAGRNEGQPLRLTLLIDQSGSMAREDRRQAIVEALDGLRSLLKEHDQVNVIGFARTPRLLAEAVQGYQGQLSKLVNIEANEGGTNLELAIQLGEQLAQRHQLEGAQNRMVLFTDGAANLGDADPDSLAEKIMELRQKGIAFDIAGIVADGLNDELLGEMARHGNGRYYVVGKDDKDHFAQQLAGAFRPAAENVKVQVRFDPDRVGRYKLIGFEKDRLNKEDFRNDSVDAAEMAAEEAGVAIYQVETLPEGEGEIGEVSVRFRDVASGKMVERSWTISNPIATPAIDQAQPSMQLAALATLVGQKLRGGALADAIHFSEMSEVIAQVSQHYKDDPMAAEMLQMIEQLK